jgi:DNA polymerase-3 subunit alpha
MNIKVLPPDVNGSEHDFTPVWMEDHPSEEIRYGLSAVRNVGAGAVQQVIEARRAKGAFTSFSDFCQKVDPQILHKKVLESLILAGAFDSLGYARLGLLETYTKVSDPILAERKAEAAGQFSLFGAAGDGARQIDESVISRQEFAKDELLRREKEILGQFVTDHPLLAVKDRLGALTSTDVTGLENLQDGDIATVGGIIGGLQRKHTRNGEPYVVFRLEDLEAGVQVVAFPGIYEKAAELLQQDRIVLLKGRVDLRMRDLQLVALEVIAPDLSGPDSPPPSPPPPAEPVIVSLPVEECTPGLIDKLKRVLASHPGRAEVRLHLTSDGTVAKRLRLPGVAVDGSDALLGELRVLLGPAAATRDLQPVG